MFLNAQKNAEELPNFFVYYEISENIQLFNIYKHPQKNVNYTQE